MFIETYIDLMREGRTRLARAKAIQSASRSEHVAAVATKAFKRTFTTDFVAEVAGTRNGRWALLLGLDRAFGDLTVGIAKGAYSSYFAGRLERLGTFSAGDSEAFLMPRRGHAVASIPLDHFGESFLNVTVVAGDQAERVKVHSVSPLQDVLLGPGEDLKIACVPFLSGLDELRWTYRDDADLDWYEVSPKAELAERVPEVLDLLDRSGAHIGLLPESTLSDDVLEAWWAAIKASKRPKKSNLKWILVGSGPVTAAGDKPPGGQSPNRAVLISRDNGDVLMTHDKISPYSILPEDITRFAMADDFGVDLPKRPLREWMAEGETTNILASQVGGVALAICEDLDRVEDHLTRIIAARPSYVFVPVLSNYLVEDRTCGHCGEPGPEFWKWEAQRASVYAQKVGCAVIVCTSFAFPNRSGVSECATSLVMRPSPVSRWVDPDWGRTKVSSAATPTTHKMNRKVS